MAAYHRSDDDGDSFSRDFAGPLSVDTQIRQAVQLCWMLLPKDRRTAETVKAEVSRIVERVFRDLDEDMQLFTD